MLASILLVLRIVRTLGPNLRPHATQLGFNQ